MINKLTGVIDFVKNFFAGGWREAWESVRSIFAGVWNSMKSIARSALNAIVSPINSIISGINKVSSAVGIKAIPAITIPQFADGATVTKPTLAVVGEGRDPETIVPHNNKPRSRRLLAEAAAGVGLPIEKVPKIDAITGIAHKVAGLVGRTKMPSLKVPQYLNNVLNQCMITVLGGDNEGTVSAASKDQPSRIRTRLENPGVGSGVKKEYSYTFAPTIYANNAQGVKEVLDDGFEKFKEYMGRSKSDDDREVFA